MNNSERKEKLETRIRLTIFEKSKDWLIFTDKKHVYYDFPLELDVTYLRPDISVLNIFKVCSFQYIRTPKFLGCIDITLISIRTSGPE